MAILVHTETPDLAVHFPGSVTADSRPGYIGWIVNKDKLIEVTTALRDEFGFDLLSSVTGVDYFPEKMEVVYEAYKTIGGPSVRFKVQVPRVDPIEIPSVTPVWPGADFQEREIWDLFGIKFINHPDLRRILMWEGFEGHPMRKDWREPFYEEDNKPLKSCWPVGKFVSAEDKNVYKDNLQFPQNLDPEKVVFDGEAALYGALAKYQTIDGGIKTDHIIVNMGPQHPSTHGVFRATVMLDGETIISLKPAMGYLHRNHEKIGERNTFLQNMPYTDRLDYFNSMSNNWGYSLAVEKLMNIKVPERAEYLRVIMAELSRIQNHLILIGMLLNDLGAFYTPALYAFERARANPGYFRGRVRCAHDVQLSSLRRRVARLAGRCARKDPRTCRRTFAPQSRRVRSIPYGERSIALKNERRQGDQRRRCSQVFDHGSRFTRCRRSL